MLFQLSKSAPRGSELLLGGDFNSNLDQPEGDHREEEIAVAMTEGGLGDMLYHFLLKRRPWCRYGRTQGMVQLGRGAQSLEEYILGTYSCLFRNVSIRDPQQKLNNYMFLG